MPHELTLVMMMMMMMIMIMMMMMMMTMMIVSVERNVWVGRNMFKEMKCHSYSHECLQHGSFMASG